MWEGVIRVDDRGGDERPARHSAENSGYLAGRGQNPGPKPSVAFFLDQAELDAKPAKPLERQDLVTVMVLDTLCDEDEQLRVVMVINGAHGRDSRGLSFGGELGMRSVPNELRHGKAAVADVW